LNTKRALAIAGAVMWDSISPSMSEVPLAVHAGVLVKLPVDIVNRNDLAPGTVNDYCVGKLNILHGYWLWHSQVWQNGPTDMIGFWDARKSPEGGAFTGALEATWRLQFSR